MAEEFNTGAGVPESSDIGMLDASVEMLPGESAGDDALQATESNLDEFADSPDDLDLDNDLDETPEEPRAQQSKQEKGINARIRAGVKKGVQREMANIRSSVMSEVQKAVTAATEPLKAQIKSYQDAAIEREAQALVASGDVKNLDIAKAYVAQKYGAVTPTVSTPKPENNPQQQAQQQTDPRTDFLAKQAVKLKAKGIDVISAYKTNPAIQQKVNSGDWDMHDVAEYMQRAQKSGKVPAPMRAANSGAVPKITPGSMSPEQWERFNAALEEGKVY
jgi:hypothetical protein